MWDFPFNILSQFDKSFTGKVLKKTNVIKKDFICLDSILWLYAFWKRANYFVLFIKSEKLLNLKGLFNKISDFAVKLVRNLILLWHSVKDLESLLFLWITRSQLSDQSTDITDIVGECNTTEGFDKNQKHGLNVVVCWNITKSDCEHDGRSPIITPYIADEPMLLLNVYLYVPWICWVHPCH